jgi:hypothetical protein
VQAEVQHVVNTLWALAVLGHKPNAPWAKKLCKKVWGGGERGGLLGFNHAIIWWTKVVFL